MSHETLTTAAIEMVILELIGQGVTTQEGLIEAMKREDVQNSVKIALKVLQEQFN